MLSPLSGSAKQHSPTYGRGMAISFQNAHSNFCRRSRTPPFPQIDGPEQILKANSTTKNPSRGCPRLKFQASSTFHKCSSYAAFEKRTPCPSFTYQLLEAKLARRQCGGLARRLQGGVWGSSKGRIFRIKFLCLCRGPSRGLHSSGLMESIIFRCSRPERGPLSNVGVDAALRRVS
jgi:hypothetical protein